MKRVKRTTIEKEKLKRLTPFFTTSIARKLKFSSSDNDASEKKVLDTIVLHWTGGQTIQPSIDTLRQNGFGYHFLIDKDGTIVQGANVKTRLSHAGDSFGPQGEYVNNYSIGISLVHWIEVDEKGLAIPKGKEDKWTEEQNVSLIRLIDELTNIEGITFKYLTGHHEISPGRKIDPYSYPNITELAKDFGLKYWKAGDSPYTELKPNNGSDARRKKQYDPFLKKSELEYLKTGKHLQPSDSSPSQSDDTSE